MAASERKSEAIEVAARPLRELLREEHDEIAAAQRALRQAEKAHDRAIELAQRQLLAARTAEPLRLGLRGQGSQGGDGIQIGPEHDALREQLVDHDRRLRALEDDYARRQAGTS
jgi:hypothetical protein